MSNLVDPDKIETIVGVRRHPTQHWARAVTAEETVYILHSQQCRDSTPDLRDCIFSRALDQGIDSEIGRRQWRKWLDQPVRVGIQDGLLAPYLLRMRAES